MSSVLQRLRNETRELHERIEAAVPVLDPGAGIPAYSWYLEKLLGFHRPLERAIFATPGIEELGLSRAAREKSPRLIQDLLALGTATSVLLRLDECRVIPMIHDVPTALGASYVLEGATLGGQVVYRQLRGRMPEVMARASAYLRCYGAGTGAQWQAFTAVLERFAGDAAACSAMVSSARDTFETFEAWLGDDQRAAPSSRVRLAGALG